MDGLAVTVEGDGPPLLFLHGIGSSRRAFDAQRAYFSDRYRCICPDAPGYGDSDDRDAIDGMDGYAEIYEDLLGHFGPAAVVGVSFGGVIAARMAMRGVADITAMVLAGTSRGSGVDPEKATAMRSRPNELLSAGPEAFAAARAPRLLSSDATHEAVDEVARNMVQAIRLPGYAHAATAMADTDHSERLAEITCPTLVVVGSLDVVCPPAEARQIAGAIPGSRLAEIAGAGHLANQEYPTAFNAAIGDFLASHHLPTNAPTGATT